MYYWLDQHSDDVKKKATNILLNNNSKADTRIFKRTEFYPDDYVIGDFLTINPKITDFVLTYKYDYGIYVSDTIYSIIKEFKLPNCKTFPLEVRRKNGKSVKYNYMNFKSEDYAFISKYEFDLYDREIFQYGIKEQSFIKNIVFDKLSSEDFINISTDPKYKLKLTNLVLNDQTFI